MKNTFTWVRSQLSRLVEIRPEERIKTMVMFFYFFSIIATIWMIKPVRNSLFIDELGAKNLRFVYMGEGLFLIGIVWAFVQFSKRVDKKTLYNGVLFFFIICLLAFRFLFHTDIPYLSFAFYIWGASYSIIMTTQFFMLANDIFNPLEAKRLFGFILSGGSLGGVLGGILTKHLAETLGTENMLPVIACVILICSILVSLNWKYLVPTGKGATLAEAKKEEEEKNKQKEITSGRKLLLGSSYLMMLAVLVMIVKLTSAVVDNQFNAVVEIAVAGKDARTAFYGGFFSFLNAISFVMQLFATSLVLRYLGVGIALWILPLGLLFGGAAALIYPVLLTSIILKSFDGSVNYSIQQATREVLYLPISSTVRYRVKPVIDMLGYRIAKSLGGVYIAVMAPLLGLRDERLTLLVLLLLPFWFFVAWRMRQAYSGMLRENLTKDGRYNVTAKPERATDVLGALYAEKTMESMKAYLSHKSSYARKLASTAYMLYLKAGKNFEQARERIEDVIKSEAYEGKQNAENNKSEAETIEFLESLLMEALQKRFEKKSSINDYLKNYPEDTLLRLGNILSKQEAGLKSKRAAVRILELIPKQEAVDLLLPTLRATNDHAFRFIILKALNKLHDKNPKLTMNRFLVKNEIAREVEIYENLKKLEQYLSENKENEQNEDYLSVTLQAISDESFERVFRLLDLLYPEEIIHIIYDRITGLPPESKTRSHAIELLNNTLKTDMLRLIQKILDDSDFRKLSENEIENILTGFVKANDQWFYLIAVFMVTELGWDHSKPNLAQLLEEKKTLYS